MGISWNCNPAGDLSFPNLLLWLINLSHFTQMNVFNITLPLMPFISVTVVFFINKHHFNSG